MSLKLTQNISLINSQSERDSSQLIIHKAAYLHLTDWTSKRSFGNFWHLYWNTRKGARVLIDQTSYPLTSQFAYIIPAHTLFATQLDAPVDHFYVDFTLSPELYFKQVKRCLHALPVDYIKSMLPLFMQQNDYLQRKTVINAMVWHYLSLLPQSAFMTEEGRKIDPRIAKAIKIMENEVADIRTVQDIYRRMRMTPNSFYLLFKQETNKTPLMYLTQIRMNYASHLLEHTDDSIEGIARQTGFADRYHFSKRYKQLTGLTPAQFRENMRQNKMAMGHPQADYYSRFQEAPPRNT